MLKLAFIGLLIVAAAGILAAAILILARALAVILMIGLFLGILYLLVRRLFRRRA